MKIKLIAKWYDFWIGVFWDSRKKRLYLLPIPCIGIVIHLERHRSLQRTRVFCPNCGVDLCSTKGVTFTDTDLVRYVCVCGTRSAWDFDAPVPIQMGKAS